jgi:hypothetical protein
MLLGDGSDPILPKLNTIHELATAAKLKLGCFRRYVGQSNSTPDFVETLLHTSVLNASNPRDYIYAIVGMTKFPAKPMSIHDWVKARQHEVFIPIDYSADLNSPLITVTWAILMCGGLGVLPRFGIVAVREDNAYQQYLLSWVINWRLAVRLFWTDSKGYRTLNRNTWLQYRFNTTKSPQEFVGAAVPRSQQAFIEDNSNPRVPLGKLLVRGTIEPVFHANGKDIWERKPKRLDDRLAWSLKYQAHRTDLVVDLASFATTSYDLQGLWLLRPTGENEYRHCLRI